jgi:hypothetical protein
MKEYRVHRQDVIAMVVALLVLVACLGAAIVWIKSDDAHPWMVGTLFFFGVIAMYVVGYLVACLGFEDEAPGNP